jgi:phosphatidylserine/phosphatidylglycerophosphate/cardiolipin synthase-like enzyme
MATERRLPRDDEAGALEVVYNALGGDRRHVHIGLVNALSAFAQTGVPRRPRRIDMAANVRTARSSSRSMRRRARREGASLAQCEHWRRGSAISTLRRGSAEWHPASSFGRALPSGELMHLKGYCIDNRLLRIGSANFSRSGETARTMTSWR